MILELEKKYLHRLDLLSSRARFVLASTKLDKFENFYQFFIEQNRVIDFQTINNCGAKTEKELNFLTELAIIYKKEILPEIQNNNKYENKNTKNNIIAFENSFDALSVRTKNILQGLQADQLTGFIENILKNEMAFKINRTRNCGEKSYKEILEFRNKIQRLLTLEPESEKTSLDETGSEAIHVNRIAEFRFEQGYDSLSTRTRNILAELEATTIDGFSNFFLKNRNSQNLMDKKNCGEKTMQEINDFKLKVIDLISTSNKIYSDHALLKDIEVYLFEGKVLKEVEFLIVRNHFGFIQNEQFKTFHDISSQTGLSKERVRQLSFKVLDKIKAVVKKLCTKGKYDMDKYFFSDNFCVTVNIAEMLNKKESTNFSSGFITYILECVENNNYHFACLNKKYQSYSGLFFRKIETINSLSCIFSFIPYVETRRTKDLILNIEQLVNKFKIFNSNNTSLWENSSPKNDKLRFIELLKSFAEYYQNEDNPVTISLETIVFQKNSKKFQYDYLAEILNHYKRPMHYTDLYNECCKRGMTPGTPLNIHATIQHHPEIFGLKGQGIYGLVEWGGYFGTIGDVTEQLLKERNQPIDRKELEDILCRELYISQSSIREVLFHYSPEDRFVKYRNDTVALKEWQTKR